MNEDFIAAVKAGDSTTVQTMLASNPELADVRTPNGEHPVQVAVYALKPNLAQFLLQAAKDVDLPTACAAGDAAKAKELLMEDQTRANEMSPDGYTPLCLAAAFGGIEIVRMLVSLFVDVNARSERMGGVAPLHAAVFGRQAETVKFLLASGANPNMKGNNGFTPLHAAAQNGDLQMAQVLLNAGAEPMAKDDQGHDAAFWAQRAGNEMLVHRLQTQASV